MVVAAEEELFVLVEFAVKERVADFFGEADDETEVVGGSEVTILGLLGGVARAPKGAEAAQRPAGATSGAVAAWVEDGAGVAELAEVEVAVFSVDFAVASFAHGGDAIESVGAHFGADENVVGMRKAEEVAWFGNREFFITPTENGTEIFFKKGTAEAETVEFDAVNLHFGEVLSGATAKILPPAALEHGVKVLAVAEVVAVFQVFTETAFGPTLGAFEGFDIVFVSVGERSEFIKSHVDVGADATLDLHGFFGADEVGLAIERVGKANAFFGDVGEALFMSGVGDAAFFFHGDDLAEPRTERHDLEATTVGDGGASPRGRVETVGAKCVLGVGGRGGGLPLGEAPASSDGRGLTTEMVAIGEHSLGAELMKVGSRKKTNIAMRADRHKSGSFNFAVGGLDDASAAEAVRQSLFDFEIHCYIIIWKMFRGNRRVA